MPKNTVVMTVYDRPHMTLINTLNALGKTGLQDTEILVVDDGSNASYEPLLSSYQGLPIRLVRCDTVKDRPGTYNIDGSNNPAYANNFALEHVDSENVFWMSSDVMVQPRTIFEAMKLDLSKVVWMPCVTDLDTSDEFLGPTRLAPFGWFFATKTDTLREVGWDEEYLKGIAFEDNDFMARLALHVKRFVVDMNVRAWHQSHPQKAYSDGKVGWDTNKRYTLDKWGGIPWHTEEKSPLKIQMTTVNHQVVLDVAMLEKVV